MAKFKVGDKVKYLDKQGGGVVTKIISPVLVNIEEDGFEIPVLSSEIIIDNTEDANGKMFVSKQEDKKEPETQVQTPEPQGDDRIEQFYLSRKGQQVEKGVYLAYVPKDQQWILTGDFDVYLVNNSDYTVIYSIFHKQEDGGFLGKEYGYLEEKERILLATAKAGSVEPWTNGIIQLLFHKEEDTKVINPVSYKLKISSGKFYKDGCFEYNDLMGQKAMVIPICLLKDATNFADKDEHARLVEKLKEEKGDVVVIEKPKKEENFFDKHMRNNREAEVDLHITELVEDETGMQAHDMLLLQMDYFKKCLDEAMLRNLDKVVFIHGVGHGRLKTEIETELKQYPFLHFFPASMKKYGVGAIEVIIGKNRK